MAKFDVWRLRDGGHVLDCQADVLRDLNTRFVVPLMPLEAAPEPAQRLNPLFEVEGRTHVMATQFAATVPLSELAVRVQSLDTERLVIGDALDMLISGF